MTAIAMLLAGYPAREDDQNDVVVAAYLKACEGAETIFVCAAVERFIKGLVDGHNRAFRPTVGQFAHETMLLKSAEFLKEKRKKLDTEALALADGSGEQMTAEEQENRRKFVDAQLGKMRGQFVSDQLDAPP